MAEKLKFGILAAGNIATKMAETLNWMEDADLVAVAARELSRAQAFAEKYHIPKAYGSYEELAADPEIQVIYIASPHSHHYEHAMLCLEHGKHVMCEKTFTVNARQAGAVFEKAAEKKLFIMEMVWTRFLPAIRKAKELIAAGAIGELTQVLCDFGIDRDRVRLQLPELAGGALLDTGIYPLTIASIFLGDDVKRWMTSATLSDKGVDLSHASILEYAGGQRAVLSSCINNWTRGSAFVYGKKGWIELPRFHGCQKLIVTLTDQEPVEYDLPFACNGFEYEVQETIDCIRAGKTVSDVMPPEQTLALLRLMDALRESWGMRFPCE